MNPNMLDMIWDKAPWMLILIPLVYVSAHLLLLKAMKWGNSWIAGRAKEEIRARHDE